MENLPILANLSSMCELQFIHDEFRPFNTVCVIHSFQNIFFPIAMILNWFLWDYKIIDKLGRSLNTTYLVNFEKKKKKKICPFL